MPKKYDQFGERLKIAMGDDSPYALAKKCNISNSLVRRYVGGDGLPGTEHLVTLSKITGANIEWLATGDGPMRKNDTLPAAADIGGIPAITEPQSFTITNLEGREVELRLPPEMRHIPIMSIHAACGGGSVVDSEYVQAVFSAMPVWFRRELNVNPQDLNIVTADGDSMADTIKPEEMVIVDRSKIHRPGDGIWVFSHNNCVFIKRLQFMPDKHVKVKSDNPHYETYTLMPDDTFRLLGRVIAALPLRRL